MTADTTTIPWYRHLFTRRMAICVLTGFSSGLPLYVLIQLMPGWLRSEGVDLKSIGLFALLQFPYNWKFLWAPLMERYHLPLLGRRRGWLLLTQLALLLAIAGVGWFSPKDQLQAIVYLAVAMAFFSASQDIVIDAYRRQVLPDEELGLGNSVHVNAYRISSLVPGSLGLILGASLPWSTVFMVVAAFMGIGLFLTLWAPEPEHKASAPKTLASALIEPLTEFFQRQGAGAALLVLAFLFFYKLGDNLAVALQTPFFIDIGFKLAEIGLVAKHAALWPSVVGGMLGGIWMLKLGINRGLWVFGVIQLFSILAYAWLAHAGPQLWILATALAIEYFAVGLGAAALVAFYSRIAHPRFLATQIALFTALTGLPRTLANAVTGYLVEGPGQHPDAFGQWLLNLGFPAQGLGWVDFFLLCFVAGIPGLLLLFKVAPWREEAGA